MEAFLEYLFMILPALRIDTFIQNIRPKTNTSQINKQPDPAPEFELFLKKEDIRAYAVLIDGEFIVQSGSMARQSWVGDRTDKTSYWKLFDELVAQGILADSGKHKTFIEDYAVFSTSAAGAVVNGRSTAGPIAWKLKGTKTTYKDWEASELSSGQEQ